jgi:phytoene synthase
MTESQDKLAISYRYCREVARKRARNFYYSFVVLPREQRDAMCAVYAFMRYCDDIADDPDIKLDRAEMLERWRRSLDSAAAGDYEDSLILPAFHDAVRKFGIPLDYFHQLIDGASMDLSIDRYRTFEDLYDYCYKVASVVGLVCIHVFGFELPEAKKYAEYCGIAFQLTNILRDVKEDAASGRVYIPEEDLRAFEYSADELISGPRDERYNRLMRFEVSRARGYYNAALPLVQMVHGSGRPGLCAMIEIYSSILEGIERKHYDVFKNSISVPRSRKVAIAARALVRSRLRGGRSYLPMLQ